MLLSIVKEPGRRGPALFPPFDGLLTERQYAIAAVFQEVWARTQRTLPGSSPDRVRPVPLHRRSDPNWIGWSQAAPTCEVDLSRLSQGELPFLARRANLETAAFIDGWISDFCHGGGTPEGLRGSLHEQRLVLLLFAFWSSVRLAEGGRKREFSVERLPAPTVERLARWRTLSLGPQNDARIDRLLGDTFVRTPYQATLDRRMIRGAVECHLVPPDGIAEMAQCAGWTPDWRVASRALGFKKG